MKKLLLALVILLAPSLAWAQCSGVFPNNTLCGNTTGVSNTPRAVTSASVVTSSLGIKTPIQLATTGSNITLSGEQTIDGVLTSASRVLVKDQTTASQNGCYVTAAGAWARCIDFATSGQVVQGTQSYVTQGNINGGATFAITTANPIVVGSSSIFFGGATRVYHTSENGMVGNNVVDDTSAFNFLLAKVYAAGGGQIVVDGMSLITGAVVFPNDGSVASTGPKQYPIRITSPVSQTVMPGYFGAANVLPGPFGFNLQYNAAVAKFDTRGQGTLEIDHLLLQDSSNDCAAFIQTTNTQLLIHNVRFLGTAAGRSACNDAIVFGGTTTTVSGNANAPFQGYGTRVSENTFSQIRRGGFFRTYANGIMFDHNTFDPSTGSNVTTSIAAATNAAAAILTITGHGWTVGQTATIVIKGATANWAAINGTQTATVLDANTFSIPVNSTTFGALSGAPAVYTGAALEFNGIAADGGNIITDNLVELLGYGYFADLFYGAQNYFAGNALFDSFTIAGYKYEATYTGFDQIIHGHGNPGQYIATGKISALNLIDNSGSNQGTRFSVYPGQGPFFDGTGAVTFQNIGGVIINSSDLTLTGGHSVTAPSGVFGNVHTSSSGSFIIDAGGELISNTAARMYSPADGQWVMWNAAQNGFTGLNLGPATASFIDLMPDGAGKLNIKLGDQSAYAPVAVGSLGIRDTSSANDVTINATSSVALTAGRSLTLNVENVAHIITLGTTANTGAGIIFPNTATDTVAMLGISNTFTQTQNLSSASNLSWNSDSFIGRSASGQFSFGTTANGVNGYILAGGFNMASGGTASGGMDFNFNSGGTFLINKSVPIQWYNASAATTLSWKSNGVLQVGTTAANNLGAIDATSYQAGGTAGIASCTAAALGATITIKGGIVTAFTGC